jgi:aldose sugar dehydrogenase
VPSIPPSGLVIYDGKIFAEWKNDAFIGGLVSKGLIRVDIDGTQASEVGRFSWNKRIREVAQGPDGYLYLLEQVAGYCSLRLLASLPS